MELRKAKFAVVDLETTGLNPKKDEILSIAIVPMTGLTIEIGKSKYFLLKPRKFRVESVTFHGLNPNALKSAPTFEEIAGEILDSLKGRVVVGHSVNFDCNFLKRKFREIDKEFECVALDIAALESVLAEMVGESVCFEDLTLDSLAKKYNMKTSYRHNAVVDALLAAQIFQIQLMKLLKYGINTLEKLIEVYELALDKRLRHNIF